MNTRELRDLKRVEYTIGDSLEPLHLWWETDGSLVDFGAMDTSTFSLVVAPFWDLDTHAFVKSTGITGQTGSGDEQSGTPNVVIAWATTGELAGLTVAGDYLAELRAVRTSDSRKRTRRFVLSVVAFV